VLAVAGLVATTLAGSGLVAPAASASPGNISTVAGGGVGDGYPATRAYMATPIDVAVDGAGNVFVADDSLGTVRKVAPNGIITTVAGMTAAFGFAGDGGPATHALLQRPASVAVDGAGRLYIADPANFHVRRVDTNGTITTIAGNGTNVLAPDGTLATAGGMFGPVGLTFDPAGNLVVGEFDRVRRIDAAGRITTIAGGGSPADGLGDGGRATSAALSGVQGVAYRADGTLFISDQNNQRIRKVSPSGIITTAAGDGNYGDSGDGGPAVNAEVAAPNDLVVDSLGNVYFAESSSNRIRRISPTGIISTFAGTGDFGLDDGDGGPVGSAHVDQPTGLAVGAGNTLYLSQSAPSPALHSRVRKVTGGIISAVAGGGLGDGDPAPAARLALSQGINPEGGLRWQGGSYFIADPGDNRVRRVGPDGVMSTVAGGGSPADGLGDGGLATAAGLGRVRGVAPTAGGELYIADCDNNRVRKVDATGHISTVAGGGSPADGVGDGGPATAAHLDCPTGILVVPAGTAQPAGTIYVTDCFFFGTAVNRVRKIDPSGKITTVAGTGVAGFNGDGLAATATQLSCPSDVALDPAGNLVIADAGNNRVRRIDRTTGIVSTIAGDGTSGYGKDGVVATSTPVNNPTGVAFDSSGRLIIAESTHARVRRVNTAGIISTVAGTGVPGFSGDGGPATQAQLFGPAQVTLDGAGNILVDDTNNVRIRRVDAGTPPTPAAGECGGVVTQSLTLQHDVGPCPAGTDGIVVGANNISVNLNGHSVLGPGPGMDDGAHAGIRLTQRSGVTVTGGRVSGFDAGVALIGSSSNTVSRLQVVQNVAPLITPNGFEGSEFGDGIVLMFSAGNHIDGNVVDANGVFDGIGLLGLGTDDNSVTNNVVTNVVGDGLQGTNGIGIGIDISPFLDLTLPGRGGSLHGNNVVGNTVRNNYTNGISVQSDVGATIAHNVSQANGLQNPFPGNGIGVQHNARAQADLHDIIQFNSVQGNAGDGINLIGDQNRITNNVATQNAQVRPDAFDLHEIDFDPTTFQPSCLSNVWANNAYGPAGVSPACVAGSGTAPATAGAAKSSTAAPSATPAEAGSPRHLSPANARLAPAAARS
jgi:sugar lactone lactonase YvrE